MRKVFVLTDLSDSRSLLTREQGKAMRDKVLEGLGASGSGILDLKGVEAISPSFADELFGGLEAAMGKSFKNRIQVRGATSDTKALITYALGYRRRTRKPA